MRTDEQRRLSGDPEEKARDTASTSAREKFASQNASVEHQNQALPTQGRLPGHPSGARTSTAPWRLWAIELIFCIASFSSLISTPHSHRLPTVLKWSPLLTALLVMVVILQVYDQKPLSTLPWHISPNTFLALFSTLTRAAFTVPLVESVSQWKWNLFKERDHPLMDFQILDVSTRGFWGSCLLLYRRKWMYVDDGRRLVISSD